MPASQNPYIELHSSSAFSFLEGSSTPEEIVEEAARLGYASLGMLDRNGFYGTPRFYKACREAGVRQIIGSAVSIPGGDLPILVETREGYRNLCRILTNLKLASEKGEGQTTLSAIEPHATGLVCLTGGSEGPLRPLLRRDPAAACEFLRSLERTFGPGNVYVELQRHFDREQEAENQALVQLSARTGLPLVASNAPRYAAPSGRLLHDILTCIRHKTNLDKAGTLLSRNAELYLKPADEMSRIFADLPQALNSTLELSQRLDFTLKDLGYQFPDYPTPGGESMDSYLRQLAHAGARERYRPYYEKARRQIEHELQTIEKLGLAGYFLIVWDIVQFCRQNGILAQGRGSAANSAVCYSLGITAVDPVGMELLFERFLSEERGEWPDIDLDLPSGDRREQVIQYVYQRYGRRGAALTANVITYRARSAAREVGKALGVPLQSLDRLSKLLSSWGWSSQVDEAQLQERFREAGLEVSGHRAGKFLELWQRIQNLPRHMGQHSGGMVICRGRLDAVVPLENARMPDRTIVQWDKDDCADLGIIKVDLLGLGMLAAIHESLELVRKSGTPIDLAHLPQNDPKVYSMLQRADTVGVFQVESRAQMATLPRLKPRCFYDIVVQVAIIRPGPIVGNMVHPYLARRSGAEPVTYLHPSLEPILRRTLGVPIFQEQLLRIAMVAAGFTGGEAEELRRALGFKRPDDAMRRIEKKLRQGLENNGIVTERADTIVKYITSFALYGFPESHAASFALIAYASAYLKAHFPAEFYTALLNNQPMGFYHPATLVKDAQHRGQRVRPVDVASSEWECTITDDHSIRLGFMYIRGLREEAGRRIVSERRRAPFRSIEDLRQRTGMNKRELTHLARVGALNCFGMKRREALWQVEKACRFAGPLFSTAQPEIEPSPLKDMNPFERLAADYSSSSVTTGPHPMALRRQELHGQGIVPAARLARGYNGQRVKVAGGVVVRQRPMTAKGFLFLSLEDETGISNIIVRPQMFQQSRMTILQNGFLIVDGILQIQDDVISIRADRVEPLPGFEQKISSHDFS